MKKYLSFMALFAAFALLPSAAGAQIRATVQNTLDSTLYGADATSSVDASIDADAVDSLDADISADATATGTSGEGIEIERADVDAEGSFDVIFPSEVSTDADLESYSRSLIAADENVSKIAIDGEMISVWYKSPAKLLGFIPVTVYAKAEVDADGNVEIDYPWYSFLTSEEEEELQAEIEARVSSVSDSGDTSSETRAEIVRAVVDAMRAEYEASAQADAEADFEATTDY